MRYEPQEFISGGNKVVVMGKFLGRTKDSGEELDLNWIHIYTFDEGRIVHFREYMDTSMQVLNQKDH